MANRVMSLQFLRAIAALAVVAHHAMWLNRGGYDFVVGAAGVDIFFVISGAVMVIATRGNATPREFLWRRLVRVVPLYWIATTAAIAYFALRYGMWIEADYVVGSFLFLPPPEDLKHPILYPGWSVNYEVLFYLVLAASLFGSKQGFWVAAAFLVVMGAAAPRFGVYSAEYYLNPRLLEFVAGMGIGALLVSGIRIPAVAGWALILAAATLFAINRSTPGPFVFVEWGVPSALLVLGITAFEHRSLVRNAILQTVGNASYALYLVHPFVIWGVDWVIGRNGNLLISMITIVVSILLGVATHLAVERPLLELLTRRKSVHFGKLTTA